MNTLIFKIERYDDNLVKLFANLHYNDVSGIGECYFDLVALEKGAKVFAQYPIPNDDRISLGNYLNQASPASELGSLHISAKPSDARGNISLLIQLFLTSSKSFNSAFHQSNLTCTLPVTYTQLNDISIALLSFANGSSDECVIDLGS